MSAAVTLGAPLAGWLMPLEEVPDPAFADRLLGDGAAIDPVDSLLRSPCDGTVTMLADTRHAVTIRTDSGIEVLVHVGIDTVRLRGEGFVARTRPGARVRRGEPLLELDLDRLARGAASLVTPIVITGDGRVRLLRSEVLVGAGDAILDVAAGCAAAAAAGGAPDAVRSVALTLEHGLHARPAARIARLSREFCSRIRVAAGGRTADAGSVVDLMALGAACGDALELAASGPDAEAAVEALAREIASGAGEKPVALRAGKPDAFRAPAGLRELRGTVASRGIAVGTACRLLPADIAVPEAGQGTARERAALTAARAEVRERLLGMAGAAPGDAADVLVAQAELLDDPGLLDRAGQAIGAGKSAAFAWRLATRAAAERLRATGNARLAERATDLADVERQVLEALGGTSAAAGPLPDGAILLASELLPSDFGRLDLAKVAGICTAGGGPTAHAALLAGSLHIPAVVGAGPGVLDVPDGARVLLDAENGVLHVEPEAAAIAALERRIETRRQDHARDLEQAARPCHTADGCRIEVFANLVSATEAAHAVRLGAEGCGLLRTEFLFQERRRAPTAAEQAREYQAVADALGKRPLVIRLLDAGGDKPMACIALPREANPLLGLRGLRVSFRHPELLDQQLAAILRTDMPAGRRVLLPLVTDPAEIRRVRERLVAVREALGVDAPAQVGAMIETPASVALADAIAREADFLSIGSNDLAQYTLALDRAHPELGAAFDHLHPAVLRQVAAVIAAAGEAHVSVCGGLASDPDAVPLLLGLGVRTLSVVPSVIPGLKARVACLTLAGCRELAAAALAAEDAASVRRIVGEGPA